MKQILKIAVIAIVAIVVFKALAKRLDFLKPVADQL